MNRLPNPPEGGTPPNPPKGGLKKKDTVGEDDPPTPLPCFAVAATRRRREGG